MRILAILLKIIRLPHIAKLRLSPLYNRWILESKGIVLGKNPILLGTMSFQRKGFIKIGNNFTLTSGDEINPVSSNLQASVYADKDASIIIGDNVGMNSPRIRIRKELTIGNNVKIGANVLIIDSDSHPVDYKLRRSTNEGTKSLPIHIEDDVWIGAHCIVLKGVSIGARSIIGAGSVITKNIPADCIAAGNPCKVIRNLNDQE